MTHILATMLSKGGVGKTAVTISLGAALAASGKRVLLIDLDPQGHLTEGVGLQDAYVSEEPGLFQALSDPRATPLAHLIKAAPHDAFFVVPANYEMMLAEQKLFMARGRENKLHELLEPVAGFDYILIDCPPSLGMLTDNALNAARNIIVPVQAETTSLRALELLYDQIESIEQGLSIHIEIVAVVANLVQESVLANKTLSDFKQLPVFCPTVIRKRVVIQSAWQQGCSIFSYTPANRNEDKAKEEMTSAFTKVAEYVMQRVEEGKT